MLLGESGHVFLNGLAVVLHERLLQEAYLAVKLGQLALHDSCQDLLWFAQRGSLR